LNKSLEVPFRPIRIGQENKHFHRQLYGMKSAGSLRLAPIGDVWGSAAMLAGDRQRGAAGITDIAADLYDLTRGAHPGRRGVEEITLFKSVGAAIEDLAAARLVYEQGMKVGG
jgi:hypothetical protein